MKHSNPVTIRLEDYRVPDFLIDTVDLRFELEEQGSTVYSTLTVRRSPDSKDKAAALVLDGQELELLALTINGQPVDKAHYQQDETTLTLANLPDEFELGIATKIHPESNTALEGLYQSSGNFCTQCEAEGFRKITYFLDRPDVMSVYTVRIEADADKYPVLLSNGNLVESGALENGRHWASWSDPFPKPCYLFALVAGQLELLEDNYTTASGRDVALKIYVETGNLDQCAHAMKSLKKAMRWDEQVFGLEYDLDIYMIVAVSDFNMGAMENKGLNIFNTQYVLAKPETATDNDYLGVESVIAHEYFHNWTGNRVTCRDWFQLSLKEGLTVFRDQEFSADMGSRAVKRIQDVRVLRSAQFAEDAGPMAHPVRPQSYQEINNFYTVTIYNKGAEVLRMMHALVGVEGFRKGMDLYFERHDGQAVTVNDFAGAMSDANGINLTPFKRWYDQAGTPTVSIRSAYNEKAKTLTLDVSQSCPPTPGQPSKKPFHIPVALGLLNSQGKDMVIAIAGETAPRGTQCLLQLRESEQQFVFQGVYEAPVVSALRRFSAPVKLDMPQSYADLQVQLAHDSDEFNRWEASQQISRRCIFQFVEDYRAGREMVVPQTISKAFAKALADESLAPDFRAELISLPDENYLAEQMEVIDVEAVHEARKALQRGLAAALEPLLKTQYRKCHDGSQPYRPDSADIGRRTLKNRVLDYLMKVDSPNTALCAAQFESASNMTDELGALYCIANMQSDERATALEQFFQRWKTEPLVVNKWLALQASADIPDALNEVKKLMEHPAYNGSNPNSVRALVAIFANRNPMAFHASDGSGYEFLANQIIRLDSLNPQLSARLLGPLVRWKRYDSARSALMRGQLERIDAVETLSRDVAEIVGKALKQD